jgi:hypothetical protein
MVCVVLPGETIKPNVWNRNPYSTYSLNSLYPLHPEHLHHLVSQVVDDFYCDPALLRLIEGAGGVAVQRGPGFLVDLGFEGGFQGAVGVVGSEEVGVADEEAFLVVVGVDEPAGDEHVESAIAGLAGGGDEVGALDGAELGTDEDGGAFFGSMRDEG